ncbi:MAG: ABC transporter permease [Rikenellaceae bacterium]|nr:ABC transporter permease [Rikenellaceae bacterium]
MKLPLLFASRYLHSKKSLSVINTTATVSSVAVGVAVAAMVILMSVYNGFDTLLRDIYDTIEADITITPAKGKTFEMEAYDWESLATEVEGVGATSLVLKENIMAEYKGRQMFATVCGVDDNYPNVVPLADDDQLWYGKWQLKHGQVRKAVVGRTIDELFADGYSVKNTAFHERLTLHALRRENFSPLLPMGAIKSHKVRHAGTLNNDSSRELTNYVFVSIDVAQELLTAADRASEVVVRVADGAKIEQVQQRLADRLGDQWVVKNRYELNDSLYKAMRFEKWSIFFILLLVTLIAAVSIVGSLMMLIIEKKGDIDTLYAIGARRSLVRQIFRAEGVLIGARGIAGGLVLGLAVAVAQMKLGLIRMPGSTFIIDFYPVEIRPLDILGVVVAVALVTIVITNLTVSRMIPRTTKPIH